jgi:elongation factor 3
MHYYSSRLSLQITEMTDAAGNVTEVKQKKKLSMREKKALIKKVKQLIADGADLETDDEEFAQENGLYAK